MLPVRQAGTLRRRLPLRRSRTRTTTGTS
jgi:hypothetical protein